MSVFPHVVAPVISGGDPLDIAKIYAVNEAFLVNIPATGTFVDVNSDAVANDSSAFFVVLGGGPSGIADPVNPTPTEIALLDAVDGPSPPPDSSTLERETVGVAANVFTVNNDRYSWLSAAGAVAGDTIQMPTFAGWNGVTDERRGIIQNISGIDLTITLPGGYVGTGQMPTSLREGETLHWRQTGPTHVNGYVIPSPGSAGGDIGKVEVEVAKWTGAATVSYSATFSLDLQTSVDFTGSEYIEILISWGGAPGSNHATGRISVSTLLAGVGNYGIAYLQAGTANHGINWGLVNADLSALRVGARGIVNPGGLIIREIRGLKYVDQNAVISGTVVRLITGTLSASADETVSGIPLTDTGKALAFITAHLGLLGDESLMSAGRNSSGNFEINYNYVSGSVRFWDRMGGFSSANPYRILVTYI